jgi:hypothetical protein
MSLYIKVFTDFYTHRKTMRVKAVLGDDAYWVLPRLWAYAANNQPDGDFSGYSDGEIAGLIGYSKDATSMLQALLQAGFLDPDRKIHDWAEHNGYHEAYAERARKAAAHRWQKERTKEKGEDKTGEYMTGGKHCFKHASSMLQASRLHGIPSTVEEVIAYGKVCQPPKDEATCREFWAYYEGQARTGPNGDVFWITRGEAVITNWKIKLSSFNGIKSHGNKKHQQRVSASVGTANEGRGAAYANAPALKRGMAGVPSTVPNPGPGPGANGAGSH